MTQKNILVIGAQGVLGKFTARALQSMGNKVLRGGRRAESAADFRLVDLDRSDTLATALEGVDLVVSSIPDNSARAERAILRNGGLLLSEASVPAEAQRSLYADAAMGATGTVVLNSGLTAVCGLVAKDLLEKFPEADTLELGCVISIKGSAGLAGCRTAHGWLTSMPGLPAVPREFTAPLGVRYCFDLSGNDNFWTSAAVTRHRRVLSYIGIAERGFNTFLRVLNRIGLLKVLPEFVLTAAVRLRPTPEQLSREPIRMRAAVYRQGKLLAARGIDAEGDYNATVLSTGMFSNSLLALRDRGGVRPGVYFVEDLFDLDDMRAELSDHRIVIWSLDT